MLFAQYMCCSPSMEVQIEETGNRKQDKNNDFWIMAYCGFKAADGRLERGKIFG